MSERPERELTGKVAVVTGASRGIGEAIATAYAAAGAAVVLSSRRQESLEEVAARIRASGGEATAVAAHTGHQEEVQAMAARAEELYGGVDILVNNAGTNPHYGPLLGAEESHWDKTFEVNLKGYFWTARALVPSMRRRGGGKIVNMASIAGQVYHAGIGVYCVTKAAVIMLTKALAAELAADGIQVNALAPGMIRTRFSRVLWKDESARERALELIPRGRLGLPEDIVGAALYLAGPASDFTTGTVLVIDGGQSLKGAS